MSVPITDTTALTVENFLFALRDKDLDAAANLLDDNLVYENVGLPTIRGKRRTMKLFAGMQRPSMGFDVKFHRIAVSGDTVLTERTDALIFGPVRLNFWVCGVFEVHEGRITLWRDYFDLFDMSKALVRGLAGAVVPALQRKF
ncbi:MAG: nuclear transport factor 2 family protein [Mycobacterium sp.]|nr:nuclear transport factor 2 family protein [Mycobacterium sp.]